MPLHYSQKIISDDEDGCIIQLLMSPPYDFVIKLMPLVQEVKVIEPTSLQEEILVKLETALKQYK